jgi:hypothetical protein
MHAWFILTTWTLDQDKILNYGFKTFHFVQFCQLPDHCKPFSFSNMQMLCVVALRRKF